MTLTGFAVCAHTFCAHKLIRARSYVVIPQIGIAMGFLLQIRLSWLRALSKGCRCWCWCCGPGCWCCQLAERAFKAGGGARPAGVVSWQSAPVLVSADCARCGGAVRYRTLAMQAAYILVPASRMSTGRGILPSYLGLCWCSFLRSFSVFSLKEDEGLPSRSVITGCMCFVSQCRLTASDCHVWRLMSAFHTPGGRLWPVCECDPSWSSYRLAARALGFLLGLGFACWE